MPSFQVPSGQRPAFHCPEASCSARARADRSRSSSMAARIVLSEVVPQVRGEQHPDIDEELDLSPQRGGALDVEGDAVALGVEMPEDRPPADKAGSCQVSFDELDEPS